MIRLLIDQVTLALLLGLGVMALAAAADPAPQRMPLVAADYPVCVTIRNGPLHAPDDGTDGGEQSADSIA